MFKLTVTLIILIFTVAYADESFKEIPSYVTGLELQKRCDSKKAEAKNGCRLYVAGVVDSYTFLASAKNLENRICIPEDVTSEQLQSIAVRYLSEHPKDLHHSAAYLVLVAIRKDFPCKDDLHPHRF